MSGPRIVLFVEEEGGDWHARRLARHGGAWRERRHDDADALRVRYAQRHRIEIPGLDGVLPDGAFVRSISAGGLEQITFRLGILHALRASGVRVWNDARAIERCVDKSTATFLFQKAGLPTPPTRVVEGRTSALVHAEAHAAALVVKPLFGSQGNGVMKAPEPHDLPSPETVGNVYYMQPYLRAADAVEFEDWRVFVSAGRILSAMVRRSDSWITNVHQGAKPQAHAPCNDMERLAHAAVKAVGADYAGVDLIRAPDGELLVLEINSNPAWKGLQSVTELDIADTLAGDFLSALNRGAPQA